MTENMHKSVLKYGLITLASTNMIQIKKKFSVYGIKFSNDV